MTGNIASYFTDHWASIEPDRLARYEKMFTWRPEQWALLEGADIGPGQTVLDYGCGPGALLEGIVGAVGAGGRVIGVDLNADLLASARQRLAGSPAPVTLQHCTDGRIAEADASVDRAVCKNVLEYVPDVDATLAELHRVLKPGGRLHAIDSDWEFVVVEPWPAATVQEFFRGAAPAFREPCIGRKLLGAFARHGFVDINVRIVPHIDRAGGSMAVLTNMAGYIRTFASRPDDWVAARMAEAQAAIAAGTFMFVLPQFIVTGTRA
jgi:ubiquinone/menaquinone biosynthesis C-methylase UbiE